MFAVVTLGYLAEIVEHVYHKPALSAEAMELRRQIDDGKTPHSKLSSHLRVRSLGHART
jgi:meiotically up-regulated gene 157 (Mug157) protein